MNSSFARRLATATVVLLAVCVVIIGARNEYGDSDNEGVVIHIYLVYALGGLFFAAFLIGGLSGRRVASSLPGVSWACLALWTVGAPTFFFLPTGWDGLWERGLGVICVVWCTVFALALRQFAQRNQGPSH